MNHRQELIELIAKALARYLDEPDWTRSVKIAGAIADAIGDAYFVVRRVPK